MSDVSSKGRQNGHPPRRPETARFSTFSSGRYPTPFSRRSADSLGISQLQSNTKPAGHFQILDNSGTRFDSPPLDSMRTSSSLHRVMVFSLCCRILPPHTPQIARSDPPLSEEDPDRPSIPGLEVHAAVFEAGLLPVAITTESPEVRPGEHEIGSETAGCDVVDLRRGFDFAHGLTYWTHGFLGEDSHPQTLPPSRLQTRIQIRTRRRALPSKGGPPVILETANPIGGAVLTSRGGTLPWAASVVFPDRGHEVQVGRDPEPERPLWGAVWRGPAGGRGREGLPARVSCQLHDVDNLSNGPRS
jgi:hypothetical protein